MAHEHSDNCPQCRAFRDKSEAGLREEIATEKAARLFADEQWQSASNQSLKFEREAAALRERERWIPVEEKLPEVEHARFLVYATRANGEKMIEIDYWFADSGFGELEDQGFQESPRITHWKALSAAPEPTK